MDALKRCVENPNMTVPYLLMASYLYYIKDESPPLADHEFDWLCSYAKQNWKRIQHPHKHLIRKSWLDSGSLYQLADRDYPLMVKGAAFSWLKGYAPPPVVEQLIRIARAIERLLQYV